MAQLTVLEYPDPRLRRTAEPVRTFDAALGPVIDDLFDTLYASGGFGLAATQVGVNLRIIVLDVSGRADAPRVFINPECLSRRGLAVVEEGCLSVPGVTALVKRAATVRVRAFDRWGTSAIHDLDGLRAMCLQHEMDHLDGTLFIDRLSFFHRLRLRRRHARGGMREPAGGALSPDSRAR